MHIGFTSLRYARAMIGVCAALAVTGCESLQGNIGLGVAGVTALGARTPAQDIEQIYYLGVFDPQEQVPPMVYRVRVHGQASVLSGMQFGSGWVHASVIDSLGSQISYTKEGKIRVEKAEGLDGQIQTGRKLIQFGPEGFREAPKDHRLVIVMGSSPDTFFNAVDQTLGVVGATISEQNGVELTKLLASAQAADIQERRRLEDIKRDAANDLVVPAGDKK
mgnify:CR=1 FL=1